MAIVLLLLLVLQFDRPQTYLAEKLIHSLENKYNVDLGVQKIKIDFFGRFKIQDILVKDHHQDTLIYAASIGGHLLDLRSLKTKQLSFKNISVSDTWVDDVIYEGETQSSLTIFSKKFKNSKKQATPFQLLFTNIKAKNVSYKRGSKIKSIVDFKNISGTIQEVRVIGSAVKVVSTNLSFVDIYGIDYKKLETDFKYSASEMIFKNTNLKTSNSQAKLEMKFTYQPSDFSNFVENVQLVSNIDSSSISLADIHKIYPHFETPITLNVKGDLTGTFNDLNIKNTVISSPDKEIYLEGDFLLKNSIHKRELFWLSGTKSRFNFEVQRLKNIVPNQYHSFLPEQTKGLRTVAFKGDLYVSRHQLYLNGGVKSNLGNVYVNGGLKGLNENSQKLAIQFKRGSVFRNKKLGDFQQIQFQGNAKGSFKKKDISIVSNVVFPKIKYQNISLSNASLLLDYKNKETKAELVLKDSLLSLTSKLAYNELGDHQKKYKVNFDISSAKLTKLFPDKISFQKNLAASGTVNIQQHLDSVFANGVVQNLHLETQSDALDISDVDIAYSAVGLTKNIELNSSDLIRLQVEGGFEFTDFEKLVTNALYKFIPGSKVRTDVKDQTVSFGLEVYPKFIKSITNKLTVDKKIKVSGVLDTQGDTGVIYARASKLSTSSIQVDSLRIVLDNSNKFLNSNISAQQVKIKEQIYDRVSLLGKKINDTLFVRSNFNSDKIDNRAVFYITTHDDLFQLGIENVFFKYLNSTWKNRIEKHNKIDYNYKTGLWNFDEISFGNKKQGFEFDGVIEKDQSKKLKLTLNRINLAEALPGIDSLKVGGIASGEVFFKEKNTLLKPAGDLVVEDLKINGVNYGVMKTSITPSDKKLGYFVKLKTASNDVENIDASGEIIVNESNFSTSTIDVNVKLDNLKLSSLSPLGRNVLSAIRGKAEGSFKLTGTLNDFKSVGDIYLKDAGLKFPYLNTNYNFVGNTRIQLLGQTFVFQKVDLQDDLYKTQGVLKGNINYDKYNNWKLDLRIDTDNLLVMNTQQKESSKYYGTGFMDGFATIKGYTSDLKIQVTGRTLENTKFVLPISDVKEAETNRFIFYKEAVKEVDDSKKTEKETTGGLTVALNLDITRDALAEVVIDQTSGSSLQGRVDGKLLVDIDKLFNFKMFGDLVVDEGLYNFKYGGIVNKPFEVKKGGTISWNGDPYKAVLDIEAIHSVKANPKVLLENLSVNRKIDVDLVTKVTGELFESSQDFLIEIPNASSNVTSELDFKLNVDENSKMRQFFSLLVSKTFFDENNLNSTGAVLSSTTSELISSAVTDIFNKNDGKFQLNFGYTAGETSEVDDFAIDDQIDIGLETEINERILINGKLGVPVGTRTQSAVVGEVKIEVLLNEDGTLRSSFFNRQNEIQYSQEEQGYTQGIGLNYQIDFNNLSEMLQKLKRKSSRKRKK